MNNIEEAKNFILQKLNECFLFTNYSFPKRIFHIYDKQALRTKKLLRLLGGKEITFKPGKNSIILFEEMYDEKKFWTNPEIIKVSLSVNEVYDLLNDILKENCNWNVLTPFEPLYIIQNTKLECDFKWNTPTPEKLISIRKNLNIK